MVYERWSEPWRWSEHGSHLEPSIPHIYIYMDITWIDNADNAHEIDKQGLKQQHIILHLTLYILALCTTD